ncbi:hypothetical protein ACFE04_012541 [Oxalis oulophora]
MKIQPIDIVSHPIEHSKPVLKSRLKRLFDRQFKEKLVIVSEGSDQFEPSSVSLDKMVRNFIEDNNNGNFNNDKAYKFGRNNNNRCSNCFNGNGNESSDDEFDVESINTSDFNDVLKNLIPCASIVERNLLTETMMIVDKNKNIKRKYDLRQIVIDHLHSLGYSSSICKSKWDKSNSYPAGEYEYIDVMIEEERVLIDVDFRSEFEIARSTGGYKAVLQSLPFIFVGKSERLSQIVSVVSEAAKLSLKKKGMHFPPWRKAEYMRSKWLSPYVRASPPSDGDALGDTESVINSECGEFDLIFGEKSYTVEAPWKPPPPPLAAEKQRSAKVVTGLTWLLKDNPVI